MKLILNQRKQPISHDFLEKADGFQPAVGDKPRIFVIRTRASLRYAVHHADHRGRRAVAMGRRGKMFQLDGARRDRVTMRAKLDTATVTITEADD